MCALRTVNYHVEVGFTDVSIEADARVGFTVYVSKYPRRPIA